MRTALALLSSLVLVVAAGQPAGAQARPSPAKERAPDAAAAVRARVESVLTVLADDQKYDKALAALELAFEQAIAYAPSDAGLLTEVAAARRLVSQLDRAKGLDRKGLFEFLRARPRLARAVAFLVHPTESPEAVYGVLEALRSAHGEGVGEFEELAAALCVVHDEPVRLRAGEGRAADPAALFGYFTRNERRMAFSVRETPAELLVFLVNSSADIGEMEWALGRHGGDRTVGKRYSDLVYDTAHFKYNRPKKISEHAYSLPNLRKYGGVCQEQAYFAAQVAKAIGVPSAEVSGQHADMAHVWVGYLQRRAGSAWFNCEEGHYDEYEEVRGGTTDPRTGRGMSQSQLELLALLLETPAESRHAAVAHLDAGLRMRRASVSERPWPPAAPAVGAEAVLKVNDHAAQLGMIARATELAPGNPEAWLTALEWGPTMTTADRQRWFDAVHRACRTKEPDFAFQVTSSLIGGIREAAAQVAAWEWLSKQHTRRPDLIGSALMQRGDCLLAAGDKDRAYTQYRDVARKHINDGPFALAAADKAAEMLRGVGQAGMVAELYEDVYRGASRPENVSPRFFRSSNFYKVGTRYAEALEAAGRGRDAEQVRRQLRAGEDRE